jgi:hypothetical protein
MGSPSTALVSLDLITAGACVFIVYQLVRCRLFLSTPNIMFLGLIVAVGALLLSSGLYAFVGMAPSLILEFDPRDPNATSVFCSIQGAGTGTRVVPLSLRPQTASAAVVWFCSNLLFVVLCCGQARWLSRVQTPRWCLRSRSSLVYMQS